MCISIQQRPIQLLKVSSTTIFHMLDSLEIECSSCRLKRWSLIVIWTHSHLKNTWALTLITQLTVLWISHTSQISCIQSFLDKLCLILLEKGTLIFQHQSRARWCVGTDPASQLRTFSLIKVRSIMRNCHPFLQKRMMNLRINALSNPS